MFEVSASPRTVRQANNNHVRWFCELAGCAKLLSMSGYCRAWDFSACAGGPFPSAAGSGELRSQASSS